MALYSTYNKNITYPFPPTDGNSDIRPGQKYLLHRPALYVSLQGQKGLLTHTP